MENQLVEVVADLEGGNEIVRYIGELTVAQRWALWNYIREQGERISRMSAGEVVLGALGGTIGALATGNAAGMMAGASAGAALGRNPSLNGQIRPVQNLPSMTQEDRPLVAPPGASSTQRMAASAAASGSTTMGATHGETSISPYKFVKSVPWNHTETVKMHYYNTFGSRTVTSLAPVQWSFRLNSIYDIVDDAAWSDVEPPAVPVADTVDGTIQTPTWRSYWANYYKYWTVINTKYRIRFRVAPADLATRDTELMVYVYHHGAQDPPLYAEPTGSGTTLISHQFRRQHKGMYYFPIRYVPDTGVNNMKQFDINSCSGEWTPGSIKHDVAEDELQQIWHKMTEVPPTREGLTIIIQKSPVNIFGGDIAVFPEVSFEYTVQLKDLKREYQYPTQITSLPAIPNAGAQVA